MGPVDDPLPGVVDDEITVHGTKGLRNVESSVFSNISAECLQSTVAPVTENVLI